MKSKGYRKVLDSWWKALAVFLLAFYFPASTLSAFPGLHNHSALPAFAADHAHDHDGAGRDGSKPPASKPDADENCRICQIHSALADTLRPSDPAFSLAVRFLSFALPPSETWVPQLLIAGPRSRGPPAFPLRLA